MLLLSMSDLNNWITSFFNYFSTPFFTVGSYSFSFLDIFVAGLKVSLVGFAIGSLVFKFHDR